MESYDVIVIGTGGIGSGVLHQIAKHGHRVLGLDRHPQAHARGSSHGETRIIRQGYFEHPDYVPLLRRAYALWRDLENETQRTLFHQTGLLEVGPVEGTLIPGVLDSAGQHGIEIERLTAEEARRTFPFHIPDEMEVIVEPTGGLLLVEACVQAQLDQAIQHGATWRQQPVRAWSASGSQVRIETSESVYLAEQLVICGGAWSAELLQDLGIPLQILEKHLYWFAAPPQPVEDLPVYFFETRHGDFYGFPPLGAAGLKLAQHSGGRPHATPFELDAAIDEEDFRQVQQFMGKHFNFTCGPLQSSKACMYTMSPDGHFIVDRHPLYDNVSFAAGLSGHGFKFSPVLGLALAQMAMGVQPELPTGFLELERFSA
jgi:monomeric sarcosine oxidase